MVTVVSIVSGCDLSIHTCHENRVSGKKVNCVGGINETINSEIWNN